MDNLNNLEPEKLATGLPWRVLIFSIIFFGVFLASYLGLAFGYKPFLNSKIAQKDQEIADLAKSVPVEEQQALLKFYSQLGNLQTLLNKHAMASKVFPFLQKVTNQKVSYTTFNLSLSDRKLALDGVAQSYDVLAQQLEAFKQAPEIERFIISQADSKEGKVNFRVSLFLNPLLLK